jgi:hypothetical protein
VDGRASGVERSGDWPWTRWLTLLVEDREMRYATTTSFGLLWCECLQPQRPSVKPSRVEGNSKHLVVERSRSVIEVASHIARPLLVCVDDIAVFRPRLMSQAPNRSLAQQLNKLMIISRALQHYVLTAELLGPLSPKSLPTP